ncbi:MAG: hypothetical protein ACP5N2_03510 [Candidatus Nanoarchaeia archaeon]
MDIFENMICALDAKNECNINDNSSWFSESFNSQLLNSALTSKHSSEIMSALETYPVLDLACGDTYSVREMLKSLSAVKIVRYVGVDKFTIKTLSSKTIPCNATNVALKALDYEKHKDLNIFEGSDFSDFVDVSKISFVNEDILTYVSLLQPKHSFNVILGGLETNLFAVTKNFEYHRLLSDAIAELIAPGAVFLDMANYFDFRNIVQGEKILITKQHGGYVHIDKREKNKIELTLMDEKKLKLESLVIEDHSGSYGYNKNDFSFFYKALSDEVVTNLLEFEHYDVRLFHRTNTRYRSKEQLIELKDLRNNISELMQLINESENKYLILDALKNSSWNLSSLKESIIKLDSSYLSENLIIAGDISKRSIGDRIEILNRTSNGLRNAKESISVLKNFSDFYECASDYNKYEKAHSFLSQVVNLQKKYSSAEKISESELKLCDESVFSLLKSIASDLPF